jgi:hypothetical protein
VVSRPRRTSRNAERRGYLGQLETPVVVQYHDRAVTDRELSERPFELVTVRHID